MQFDLHVKRLLFLFDFKDNRILPTNFIKSPNYEISEKKPPGWVVQTR
jgi:hypothetical protein